MTQFYTYLHCKPNGDPFYVGKGTKNRVTEFSRRNRHHQHIVEKYGRINIQIYSFVCESEQQAFADEIQQIAQLRDEGYKLCNQTSGGEGTSNPTIETLEKRSASLRGQKRTALTKKKMSIARKGYKMSPEARKKLSVWHTGRKASPETCAKRSISLKGNTNSLGYKQSSEHIAKVVAHRIGKKFSPEHCAKISIALTGKKASPETRMKQSIIKKNKPWSLARRAVYDKKKEDVK